MLPDTMLSDLALLLCHDPLDDQPERMVQLTKDIRAQAEKIHAVELQMWSSPAGLGYLNWL